MTQLRTRKGWPLQGFIEFFNTKQIIEICVYVYTHANMYFFTILKKHFRSYERPKHIGKNHLEKRVLSESFSEPHWRFGWHMWWKTWWKRFFAGEFLSGASRKTIKAHKSEVKKLDSIYFLKGILTSTPSFQVFPLVGEKYHQIYPGLPIIKGNYRPFV